MLKQIIELLVPRLPSMVLTAFIHPGQKAESQFFIVDTVRAN